MKRRDLLTYSLQLSALTAGSSLFNFPNLTGAFGATATKKKLVVVFLRGGADTLGMFSPNDHAGIAKLATLRDSDLILQAANRMNPGLPHYIHKGLKPVFMPGSSLATDATAVMHTGSINGTRSHFQQMDYIESGSSTRKTSDGFLSRALKGHAATAARPTLSISNTVPYMLRGADPSLVRSPAMVAGNLNIRSIDKKVILDSKATVAQRLEMFRVSEDCAPGSTLCTMVKEGQAEFGDLQAGFDTVTNKVGSDYINTLTGRTYLEQTSSLTKLGWMTSAILMGDFNPSVVTIDVGGWDTHNKEGLNDSAGGGFYGNLSRLGEMLGNLRADLSKPDANGNIAWNDTVVVVMSEFGRTAVSNGSAGTDHGRGGAMLLMGGKVNPSHNNAGMKLDLANLDGDGSSRALQVKVDYRTVLGEVLYRHMGLPIANIFDGHSVTGGQFQTDIKT